MDDINFKFEVHYGGTILWNPNLEYFGGIVQIVYDKDPDRLSYFEIEGICDDLGIDEPYRFHYLVSRGNLEQDLRLINDDVDVVSMCKLHAKWPIDAITLHMESGHAPHAVEVPKAVGGGEDGDGQLESNGDSVVVEEPNGAATAIEEEFDWLNESLEGEDFDDDLFGMLSPPHSVPLEPNTVPPKPNNDPPQPTTDTPQPNTNTPPTNTDTPQPNIVIPPYIDVDKEWAKPALKDDIASMDGSDDEQRPGYLRFNEKTDMRNDKLVKGMKFPNFKVFRKALREYVIQKHIDIK